MGTLVSGLAQAEVEIELDLDAGARAGRDHEREVDRVVLTDAPAGEERLDGDVTYVRTRGG